MIVCEVGADQRHVSLSTRAAFRRAEGDQRLRHVRAGSCVSEWVVTRKGISVRFCLALSLIVAGAIPCAAGTIFVDDTAPAGGDGLAWTSAFVVLQDALDAARIDATIDAIHVAAGVYRPDRGTFDRLMSFELVDGVAVLGGFPDGGGSLGERDPNVHVTTLAADLLGDDQAPDDIGRIPGQGENTEHLVKAVGCGATTMLDGFVLRGGQASTGFGFDQSGGNVSIDGGGPVISNCRLLRGWAGWGGGGLAARDAAPRIDGCVFIENGAEDVGGGAAIYDGGSAEIRNCRFRANAGGSGSGLYCGPRQIIQGAGNATTVEGCEFVDNNGLIGATSGGGILLLAGDYTVVSCRFTDNRANGGGGIYVRRSAARIEQCVFSGNDGDGDGGGAIYVEDFNAATPEFTTDVISCLLAGNNGAILAVNTNVNVINSTIAHNRFPGHPIFLTWPPLFTQGANFTVTNTIVWGNADLDFFGGSRDFLAGAPLYTVSHSIVEDWDGVLPGSALDADPLFLDPNGADGMQFTAGDNNYRLRLDSPALDAGDDAALPAGALFDVDGYARCIDGDGDGLPTVDIGAFERCRVDLSGDGAIDTLDSELLFAALAGPDVASSAGDLDADADSDVRDFAVFQRLLADGCE